MLVILGSETLAPVPIVQAIPGYPAATNSHYIETDSNGDMLQLGCAAGDRAWRGVDPQRGLYILHFGAPRSFGNGVYGASRYSAPDGTTHEIAVQVMLFLLGYDQCNFNSSRFVIVGVGTSNQGTQVSTAHGTAWANMIDDLNREVDLELLSAYVAGANDIEPDWSSKSTARAWGNAYAAATDFIYYHFGSADGCSQSSYSPTGACNNGWKQDDVWYTSWGILEAWPVPQIYATSGANANQWFQISLLSFVYHNGRLGFQASMTQWTACNQPGYSCSSSVKNTPNQGYSQLQNKINSDSRTAYTIDRRTDIMHGTLVAPL